MLILVFVCSLPIVTHLRPAGVHAGVQVTAVEDFVSWCVPCALSVAVSKTLLFPQRVTSTSTLWTTVFHDERRYVDTAM